MNSILDLKKGTPQYNETLNRILNALDENNRELTLFLDKIESDSGDVTDDQVKQIEDKCALHDKRKKEILTDDTKILLFRHHVHTTKDEILNEVMEYRKRISKISLIDKRHTAGFYHAIDNIAERFSQAIESTHFFTKLEDWWFYAISFNSSGFELLLRYADKEEIEYDPLAFSFPVIQSFSLIKTQCRLLSVTEYGEQYGIDQGTIRQWIRRCKLRAAVKKGTEWFIPEFEDIPTRGFTPATYFWNETLYDIPEEYSFLEKPGELTIVQDKTDKKRYTITVNCRHSNQYKEEMDETKRECIERFLIAHPQIQYKMFDSSIWETGLDT